MLSNFEKWRRSPNISARIPSGLLSVSLSKSITTILAKVLKKIIQPLFIVLCTNIFFLRYKEATVPPALWLEQSLNTFREALLNLTNPSRPPSHAPLERTPNFNYGSETPTSQQGTSTPTPNSQTPQHSLASPMRRHVLDNFAKLMTSCTIMRIEDFTLYRVTTSGRKQMPKEFISGEF